MSSADNSSALIAKIAIENTAYSFDREFSYLIPEGLLHDCAAGKRVPQDLCVIGYNDSALCTCTEPEMTSVDNKLAAICDHIVITMMGVLEGKEMPQRTVFGAELIRRETTR